MIAGTAVIQDVSTSLDFTWEKFLAYNQCSA